MPNASKRAIQASIGSGCVGEQMIPIDIGCSVTVLDLGAWGAVYTQGWDRQVAAVGAGAKRTKQTINRERIYPPRSRNPADILTAAAPVVQAPPQRFISEQLSQ
jgi:NADH dehydrogenase